MNHHEREFFISSIRSGKVIILANNIRLEIRPLTLDQVLEANIIYDNVFKTTYQDGIMTENEVLEWMNESGLWTIEHEEKTESLRNDIEKLKTEIYNYRFEYKQKEEIRKYIRAAEKYLSKHLREKSSLLNNTRESYALLEKMNWSIRNSTYLNDNLYDFEEISLNYVIDEYYNSIFSDSIIRELAREEPWKSLWSIRNNSDVKLFKNNEDEEITHNQKNLLIWSQVYENIQESLDCPEDKFIKDDDVLDGWFLVQSQKRKQEQLEREMENEIKNDKIKNSNEVFVVTQDKENARRIDQMNDPQARAIKQQRFDTIIKNKSVNQSDLPDEKLGIQMQINNSRLR